MTTSSLLLCAVMLGLPTVLCATVLELIIAWWHSMISYGTTSWLVVFKHPGAVVLIILFIAAWVLLERCSRLSIGRLSFLLSLVLLVMIGVLKFMPGAAATPFHVRHPTRGLFVIQSPEGNVSLVDVGYFAHKRFVRKTLEYDLKPYLIKTFGTLTIDTCVMVRPGKRTAEAQRYLTEFFQVKRFVLPKNPDFQTYLDKLSGIPDDALQKLLKQYTVKGNQVDL